MIGKTNSPKKAEIRSNNSLRNWPVNFLHNYRRGFTVHFNNKGCITAFNEQMAQLSRLEEVQLLNLDLLNDIDCSAFSDSVKETLIGRESHYHGSLTLKDLYFPAVDCRFYPYKNGGNGSHPGMVILEPTDSLLSITAEAINDNARQAQFLMEIINSLPQPLYIKDDQHRWILFNEAALRIRGLDGDNVKGKTDHELFTVEKGEMYWQYDDIAFEKGSSVSEEILMTGDGKERTVQIMKNMIVDPVSGRKFLIGTINDITDFRKLEADSRKSEVKYRDFFNNAYDYLFTTDLEGNFTNANRALLDAMKISTKEIQKLSIFDFCKPDVIDDARKHFYGIRDQNENIPFEFEIKGTNRTMEVRGKMILENGVPAGVQAIGRDVTKQSMLTRELTKYSESLKALNENKDKFYSIIAHDLKSPFNSLLGFTDMLFDELDDLPKEEIRKYVSIIRSTTRNSYHLLENLLRWSRLLTGRMPFVPEKLSAFAEINQAIDVLSSMAYRKKITIENELDRTVQVFVDPQMFQSIVENLLSNAIKYSYPGSKVNVFNTLDEQSENPADSQKEKMVTIVVRDYGKGLTEQEFSGLFDLGTMQSTPGTASEQGTGLGLKIAAEMVERCGGKIWAESHIEGMTTFFFTVPQI